MINLPFALSMLFSLLVSLGQMIRQFQEKKLEQAIGLFIFMLFMAQSISMISELINYLECTQYESVQLICPLSWLLYCIALQSSIAWILVLSFCTLFLITSNNHQFLAILQSSRYEFFVFAFLIPIIINVTPLFTLIGDNSQISANQFSIFDPQISEMQILILNVPLIVLIIVIILFNFLSLGNLNRIKKYDTLSTSFKDSIQCYLILLPLTFIFIDVPLIACWFFENRQMLVYQIFLCFQNLQGVVFFVIYGFNPHIQQIQILKITDISNLRSSLFESSGHTESKHEIEQEIKDSNNQSIKTKFNSNNVNDNFKLKDSTQQEMSRNHVELSQSESYN